MQYNLILYFNDYIVYAVHLEEKYFKFVDSFGSYHFIGMLMKLKGNSQMIHFTYWYTYLRK